MEGLTKAFLLLIGLGMLIYYLGAKAFGDAFPDSQPGDENQPTGYEAINPDDTDDAERLIEWEKALDEREAALRDQEGVVTSREQEAEDRWALIERENAQLSDEKAALDAKWQELYRSEEELTSQLIAQDEEKARLQQEWQEIEDERESQSAERERLDALAQTLTLREAQVQSQEQWLQTETTRIRKITDELEMTKVLLIMLAMALASGSAIFNIVMFAHYRDKVRRAITQKKAIRFQGDPRHIGDIGKPAKESEGFPARKAHQNMLTHSPASTVESHSETAQAQRITAWRGSANRLSPSAVSR